MKYNKDKMVKLVSSDRYLQMMLNDMLENKMDSDRAYQVLYNANVDDGGMGDYRHVYEKL